MPPHGRGRGGGRLASGESCFGQAGRRAPAGVERITGSAAGDPLPPYLRFSTHLVDPAMLVSFGPRGRQQHASCTDRAMSVFPMPLPTLRITTSLIYSYVDSNSSHLVVHQSVQTISLAVSPLMNLDN